MVFCYNCLGCTDSAHVFTFGSQFNLREEKGEKSKERAERKKRYVADIWCDSDVTEQKLINYICMVNW